MSQGDLPQPGRDVSAGAAGGISRCVVAVDGPSGTGKSTVSRRLAQRLGIRYLDTGAMYRAATLAVLRAAVPLSDTEAVADAVTRVHIEISTDPHRSQVELDGRGVLHEIRSGPVTGSVSAVSAVPAVRAQLVRLQRELIGAGGIVVEGRDIGSVVWPAALPKIYLCAHETVRARRRAAELGSGADLAAVSLAIARRDRLDTARAESPLLKAPDAIEMDTTSLGIDEVVNRLVDIVREQVGGG